MAMQVTKVSFFGRICSWTLLTSILTVFSVLTSHSITDHEHRCTSHLHLDGTLGSQPVCLNFMNAKYLTIRTLPLLLSHSSDVCWSSATSIPYVICSFELWLATQRQTRASKLFTVPRSLPVDILFVIEQSTSLEGDETKQERLEHVLNTLIATASADTRFGAILYSLDDHSETRTTRFCHIITTQDKETFLSPLKSEGSRKPTTHSMDPGGFWYTSLKSNLEEISHFLSNNSMSTRDHSDLYIISILDLYPPPTQSPDREKTAVSVLRRDIEQSVTDIITALSLPQSNPLSLQFVFRARNYVATRFLGDPTSSSRYEDCSHFNKATTLKALLRGSNAQGNTLQAHLLSMGIPAKITTWNDLKHEDCVHNMVPTLSGHFSLHPTFRNNCHLAADCKDCYCSPIHGWVEREVTDQSSELFEGRSPISSTFSASHEDLALASINESISTELPEEKLTIYLEPELKVKTTTRISGTPKVLQWSPSRPIAAEIIGQKQPLVLRNTVVQSWPAMVKWNMTYLSQNLGIDNLESVKCSDSYLTFDPDRRTSLQLNISIPFITRNMSREEFFSCIDVQYSEAIGCPQCSDSFIGHYHFGSVPATLKEDLMPDRFLYHTDKDYKSNRQFIWISSPGMLTHTHFDQDYNLFVQLVGRKRFTLWSPFQHELMYTYPRVHPLWHKSQVNYRNVDTRKFPAYSKAEAVQVELGPGDMLYVPPYTWHYVETLSASVSLSTWSHDYNVYNHMNAIYRHDHKFDLIESPRGQMFVLRLYLDMMVHHFYGVNETTPFFVKLVETRFSSLTHLFPPHEDDPLICGAAVSNKIPTCVHVHGYAKLDMLVVGDHFEALEPEVRDILFMDYVEEITAQVVGVKKMLAFFRYCFLGQEYYVTEVGDDEHSLWDYKDTQEEET